MYNDQYHPQVKRDLKKLSSELRERIKTEHIPAILSHPEGGDTLVGDLKGIWSYHFSLHEPTISHSVYDLSLFKSRDYSDDWKTRRVLSIFEKKSEGEISEAFALESRERRPA